MQRASAGGSLSFGSSGQVGILSVKVNEKQKTKNQDNCRHPEMAVGDNRFE
jgi:hypothetical protein